LSAHPSMAKREAERTIVIVGVERGGTSMVAAVVRALGINLGDRAGHNHEDPKFLTDDREKLLVQIKQNNSRHNVWGFKLPKASLMIDFYNESLRNPYYILVFRNIAATVDSWCTRGTNDPFETGKHAIKYYLKALEDMQFTNRPTLFVSYERACQNVDLFVDELAEFLGVELDEENKNRACSMVSGDGGGYLNLPEYYFHVDELDPASQASMPFEIDYDTDSVVLGEMSSKRISERFIIKPANGNYFPQLLYLLFDLDVKDSKTLLEDEIRLYMDFTGDFFPGHAYRPRMKQGKNLLKLESNGKVKRVALGGLYAGIEYAVDQIQVHLLADEQKLDPSASDSIPETHWYKMRVTMDRVIAKLKRVLRWYKMRMTMNRVISKLKRVLRSFTD